MSQVAPPNSRQAEEALIGQLLVHPEKLDAILMTSVKAEDFYHAHCKLLFEELIERFYAGDQIDPLLVGESVQVPLSKLIRCPGPEAVEKVRRLAAGHKGADASAIEAHARLVKSHADMRALLELAASIERTVEAEEHTPGQIAAGVAQTAMHIATDTTLNAEVIDYGQVGRNFVRTTQMHMAARAKGIEIGVQFGFKFIDDRTGGIRGSELFFLGGIPGVGKSSVAWTIGQAYAERQMQKTEDNRIGTLILSLEMAEEPSSVRLAQRLTGVDGQKVRRGEITNAELNAVTAQWAKRQDIPLWFNFTSALTAAAMRAMVSEAVRQHNVGFVIIDHFRYFNTDRPSDNPNTEDDQKVRFLKEGLAKDLDVAVMCLAHTTKSIETEDSRPKLRHLRGSGQIAADADFVAFVHRPYVVATDEQKAAGKVRKKDAELIFEKNRHGEPGIGRFDFEPAVMEVKDR